MARVLIFTSEPTSLPGVPTGGRGVRIEQLARGLAAHGHEVTVSVLAANLERLTAGGTVTLPDELKRWVCRPGNAAELIAAARPAAVVVSPWPLAETLGIASWPADLPVVFDLPGLLSLENLFEHWESGARLLQRKAEVLHRGDLFCVSNPRQKHYLYACLQLAGVDLRDDPVRVVSLACDPKLPTHQTYPDPPVVVASGVTWKWQDQTRALATAAAFAAAGGGELHLYTGGYPYADGPAAAVDPEPPASDRVRRFGLIDHAELLRRYTQASAALELYRANPERELASTTRTMEYLGTGLPVIYSAGMHYAELIGRYDAGWVIDPEDEAALRRVLDEIRARPAVCREKGANALRLAREQFDPVAIARPLAEFCARPARRANRPTQFVRQHRFQERTLKHLHALHHRINQLRDQYRGEQARHVREEALLRDGTRQAQAARRDSELRRAAAENELGYARQDIGRLRADLDRITGRWSFRVLLRLKKLADAVLRLFGVRS